MVVVKINDLDSDTFLEGFENDKGKFFINIGYNDEHEKEHRFTTLDIEDAYFLIRNLTDFVTKNKEV